MEFESWWLLVLPALFAAGWYAARFDLRQTIRASRQLPATYFRGLNNLLHDEPDQAVKSLLDVVKLDPDTPELHFALGTLYRRRGETEKAIRIHQNLLDRRDLDTAQRDQVQFELGQDYFKAGLLDRAEASLAQLKGSELNAKADQLRLTIAQTVRDWPLVVSLANEQGQRSLALHAYCTIAEDALLRSRRSQDDPLAAEEQTGLGIDNALDSAAQINPDHPRVLLLQANQALTIANNPNQAISIVERLISQNPKYLSLAATVWFESHTAAGGPEVALNRYLDWYSQRPSAELMLVIAKQIEKQKGIVLASGWLETALRQLPSIVGLEQLSTWRVVMQTTLASRDQVAGLAVHGEQSAGLSTEMVQAHLKPLSQKIARYTCKHCAFQARQFYWQCPGCSQWETYPTTFNEA
jgi:lipopolysaccharide assembly protein B